ncbi:LamG-like jellyroll fold domain-containing protein [Tamlana sp. 2201CG12-4]|uniref:LamG-like jellyroll fold domain-containing protein n=1 Tax=Tamlana sp. 2201CG12-4 TaxID=3112582 RepID=UPI002DBCE470|nr:LamG-like jellyroll fold domain-containing protein [Tamlana sp. 2201CG12-4]MEC3907499.1 LamG-like jellyroll fold domain-containing protein [Tamlana sp. 2201CG12-4]
MRRITLVLVLIVCQSSFTQVDIKVFSVDSGGGSFNVSTVSVVSTIGEVVINEYSVNTLGVSEGFIGKSQLDNQVEQNLNCVAPPNSLISWWAGEDNANDSVGSNDGTPLNGVSYTSGVVNKAFLFDGVDDVVIVPNSASLNITGDLTIELWVRRIGYANRSQTVICKGAGYVPDDKPAVFAMRFENDLTEFLFEDINGNNVITNGPAYEDSQWHHYAYVRQGNQHIVYADGFDFGWTSFSNLPESADGLPLTIGAQYHNPTNAQYDYDHFFHGEVDEIGVYNRALSESEIQSIYNAGSDGKCATTLNIEDYDVVENKIRLYPNPVKNMFILKLNETHKNVSLELYDVFGKKVKRIENFRFRCG